MQRAIVDAMWTDGLDGVPLFVSTVVLSGGMTVTTLGLMSNARRNGTPVLVFGLAVVTERMLEMTDDGGHYLYSRKRSHFLPVVY